MPAPKPPEPKAGIDSLDVLFFVLFAAIAGGAVYLALNNGWFHNLWEVAGLIAVGIAFVLVRLNVPHHRPVKNADVYGAAKTASEAEAQAAARGDMKTASLHDQTFPN